MKKRTLTIIALILFAGVIVFMLFPKKKEVSVTTNKNTRRILPVTAYVVKPQNVTDSYQVNSVLLPSEEVDLSFETSGKITHIYFKEGSSVKKGDLLAKVNDARLQAQLGKFEAQLELYTNKEFRQKSLLENDAISLEAYQESRTLLETTKADIELVEAQIKETELRAPFDGVLGLRQISEGAYATPATIIVKITKLSPLKLEFSVPEIYVNIVKPGTSLLFNMDSDTTKYKSTIYATDATVDPDVHMYTVRAYYPNKDREISPGRFASVQLQLSFNDAGMSVPSESVIPEMGYQIVYTAKQGKAVRTVIEPGLRTASSVQILSGLNFGDTIITTGILQLREGIDINITNVTN